MHGRDRPIRRLETVLMKSYAPLALLLVSDTMTVEQGESSITAGTWGASRCWTTSIPSAKFESIQRSGPESAATDTAVSSQAASVLEGRAAFVGERVVVGAVLDAISVAERDEVLDHVGAVVVLPYEDPVRSCCCGRCTLGTSTSRSRSQAR